MCSTHIEPIGDCSYSSIGDVANDMVECQSVRLSVPSLYCSGGGFVVKVVIKVVRSVVFVRPVLLL